MTDTTEAERRQMTTEINEHQAERQAMEVMYGQVWNTDELTRDFSVESFMAPFVVVTNKQTGERGTLMFQHRPRYYYGFKPA